MGDSATVKARTYGDFLNLTKEQTTKLKEFWKLVLDRLNNKQININEDNDKAVKNSSWRFSSVISRSYETQEGLKISNKTGEELKSTLSKIIKCDHPDIKAIKYLIARKWKAKEAYKMFINSLDYFSQDIHEQTFSIAQMNAFFYQKCKDGRLIMYIIASRCFASKYTIDDYLKFFLININNSYLLLGNQARMTVVLNMNGYTLANTDINHIKIMANLLPNHFPELMTKFIIHDAPWIFNSVWYVISPLFEQRTRDKLTFTQGEEIKKYIDDKVLLKSLGGSDNFNYQYFPPSEKEGLPKAYDDNYLKLVEERKDLIQSFEKLTYKWTESNDDQIKANRDEIGDQLASNYVKMSEYDFCKNIYHRLNVIQGYDNVNWVSLNENRV
ncbi:CRAL/TRIO domain-containing protein [Conidiobolus coronatus NRRL 28638]|uniref:CRAL/TRIO domain-containing protein n=1 Tax=Conidiobolus coronatus (strain ATCC 28846 / CBS 209.66 / NRRL 28638) TaxID=796925 RepID=A0A137PIZ2_CONC2|nr:CRAL/TRIO domain-containing protein [Conidiobolus coronatus NRRL 28638]|eukprot:KXN74963.1 CRAL/TRIO domain-containing protein [Conidiobolus coronatus NRRL 28638]